MRFYPWIVAAALSITTPLMAQGPAAGSPPSAIGNRANGFSYQPTPGQVAPRERAAGVQAPSAQQQTNNQDLEQIDNNLLRKEGLSTKSVPKLTTGQQRAP